MLNKNMIYFTFRKIQVLRQQHIGHKTFSMAYTCYESELA